MTQHDRVREFYRQKIDKYERELAVYRHRDIWLGRLRVALFLPAIVLAYYGVFHAAVRTPWIVAAALFVLGFMAIVRTHERVLRLTEELRERLRINEFQLARLDRRWSLLPNYPVEIPTEFEAITADLDLFGHASVYQFISQAHTPFGRDTLRDWLLVPASISEINDRQQAASSLAPAADVREELALRGRMLGANDQGTFAFIRWAEEPPLLHARPWLLGFARTSALVFIVALAGALLGLIGADKVFLLVLVFTCLNLLVIARYGGRVHEVLDRVASRSHDIRQYRPLFETIAALPQNVPLFAKLHNDMGATPHEPVRLLNDLTRLVRFANLRRDGMFGIPYYVSQLFLLTDFHVLLRMERWQRQHGTAVQRWLQAVGQVEAVSSLATLAHDNPHWIMPVVENQADTAVFARALGHPLIAEANCVRNDVEIGPAGTFVLVTGSNMSGKSTYLRAVGLNLILAQAGAPVCAQLLKMPPVEVATSMRNHDSLADGVSFFLAELRRLKQIVDQSRDSQRQSKLLVYLLDEILQGTNSAERHIAVSRVVGHLIANGSIGMVSTHDLELAHSPALAATCRSVHFRESITGTDGAEQMTFDYKLHPGLAPTTNALRLLKFVGLDE